MIASPGDVLEERNVARDVIHEWNYVHSSPSTGTVLIPVGWETHSSPDLGGRPQQIINERVLKNCDLLIGIFWTKLGTPTGDSASGTAEEIERHVADGKPAMVYFSEKPIAPDSIDSDQYAALQKFKEWCKTQGLIWTFENIPDFQTKFTRQLQLILKDNSYLAQLLKIPTIDRASIAVVMGDEAVPSPSQQAIPSLSEEAKQLLLEAAADRSGTIMKLAYIGGQHLQTHGKAFGDARDRRSQARWEHALEQLESERLIVPAGDKGQLFKLTELGYQVADKIGPP
jgi:hypothetical protein